MFTEQHSCCYQETCLVVKFYLLEPYKSFSFTFLRKMKIIKFQLVDFVKNDLLSFGIDCECPNALRFFAQRFSWMNCFLFAQQIDNWWLCYMKRYTMSKRNAVTADDCSVRPTPVIGLKTNFLHLPLAFDVWKIKKYNILEGVLWISIDPSNSLALYLSYHSSPL